MMNGDKKFEKLGYEKDEKDIIGIAYCRIRGIREERIIFTKDKQILISFFQNNLEYNKKISLEELDAINCAVKELKESGYYE